MYIGVHVADMMQLVTIECVYNCCTTYTIDYLHTDWAELQGKFVFICPNV